MEKVLKKVNENIKYLRSFGRNLTKLENKIGRNLKKIEKNMRKKFD